jgi:hypothetical protein
MTKTVALARSWRALEVTPWRLSEIVPCHPPAGVKGLRQRQNLRQWMSAGDSDAAIMTRGSAVRSSISPSS